MKKTTTQTKLSHALLISALVMTMCLFTIKSNAQVGGVSQCSSTIQSNFNGTDIPAGDYIWFSAVVKVNGSIPSYPATILFEDQIISYSKYNLYPFNAELIIDDNVDQATTTFNGNMWVTTAPPNASGNYFLSGYAYQTKVKIPGGINPVSWGGNFTSNETNLNVNWQWAAAVYTKFSTNLCSLGVKPTDDNKLSCYQNSDHAGTPECYKNYVTGGARGGGGSNYTGSLSGTASVIPCIYHLPGIAYKKETNNSDIPFTSVASNYHIYPNPTTGSLTINGIANQSSDITIIIVDMLGRELAKQTQTVNGGNYSVQMNLSGQPDGMYFIDIVNGNQIVTNKIMKAQ